MWLAGGWRGGWLCGGRAGCFGRRKAEERSKDLVCVGGPFRPGQYQPEKSGLFHPERDRFALGARITWSHHCCLLYVFVVFDHFSISNIVRYKGKGKGSVEYWAARVKPGRIMLEIDGVPKNIAKVALELAAAKLPIQTKIVTRLVGGGN